VTAVTTRPPRKCLQLGCRVIGSWRGGYCESHSRQTAGGYNRPLEKFYRRKLWYRFRDRFLQLNPICQRIKNGKQCTNAATELHHLKEPKTIQELLDPKNVTGVCVKHHPGGVPGTPWWKIGIDYVPTVWVLQTFSQEQP